MYAIETTPGFVIDSRPRGEAGRTVSIFTRQFGFVEAMAAGMRLEKSKLRYFCLPLSFGTFSLVRGRESWRLVGAAEGDRETRVTEDDRGYLLLARIADLLKRLLHGEEPNPELFDLILECARFLRANPELSSAELRSLESIVVFKVLMLLGYAAPHAVTEKIEGALSLDLVHEVEGNLPALNRKINAALKESQL